MWLSGCKPFAPLSLRACADSRFPAPLRVKPYARPLRVSQRFPDHAPSGPPRYKSDPPRGARSPIAVLIRGVDLSWLVGIGNADWAILTELSTQPPPSARGLYSVSSRLITMGSELGSERKADGELPKYLRTCFEKMAGSL